MGRILRDIFSGVDNNSIEAGRVLWFISVLSLIAYQGVALAFKNQTFGPIEFGTGLAALLAAGGFGIAQKDKALPGNQGTTVVANVDNVEIKQ